MTDVEKWVEEFKNSHTWETTIREILKLYEFSPMIERTNPYAAFCGVLQKLHNVNIEPAMSYELRKQAIDVFKKEIKRLYPAVMVPIFIDDQMSIATAVSFISRQLYNEASVPVGIRDVAEFCKNHSDSERDVLYYMTGLTLESQTHATELIAAVLTNIAYRFIFNCGELVVVPKIVPKASGRFTEPEHLIAYGKVFFGKET